MYVTHLRCLRCGLLVSFDPLAYLCPRCGSGEGTADPGILDVQYDYVAAAHALRQVLQCQDSRHDVFRFLPVLPLFKPGEVLPAGDTPLVAAPRLAARLGLAALYLKDETRNPTRCLKDRATALAITMAQYTGRADLYCASAGNAAISLAGFCAHQGLGCHVFLPREVSQTRLAWLHRYGAQVHISEGSYDQAFTEAEQIGAAQGWYSRNCAFNPYLVEGKKTAAYEIAEQLTWQVPDVVVAPVGDGCTLGALGKGFRELMHLGFTEHLPRLVGVQAEAIQPVVQRYRGEAVDQRNKGTLAASIAVRRPRNYLRLHAELNASQGMMLAVPDSEMQTAQQLLAREAGTVAELTSAASLAGFLRLATVHSFAGQVVVLVITGGRLDSDA